MSSQNDYPVQKQPESIGKPQIFSHDSSVDAEPQQTTQNGNPGLKELQALHKLDVVQRLDALEVCLGWTRNNRYCIYNNEGDQIFYIYEASVCFNRQVTGAMRGLALKVSLSDEDQQDVMFLRRPGACSSRCCWACCNLQQMDVVLTSGEVLASIHEVWTCCVPEYRVLDSGGQVMWTVRGGVCHCRCCCQLNFQFSDTDGQDIATVTRQCYGCKEIISAANGFTIEFADDLTPQQKLLVFGCSFLVDLNYFEKQNKCW